MIALGIAGGVAVGLLALAALIWAASGFVRALASLLPSAGQFLTGVQDLRTQNEERHADWRREWRGRGEPRLEPTNGVAPPPLYDEPEPRRSRAAEYPTSAQVPGTATGDVDRFDESLEERPGERPTASGSKLSAPPPGPKIQGE